MGRGRRRKFLVLGICCMSVLIVSMDTTIVNVALPSISAEFDAPISGLQWTIDAYVVVLASFLLLSGSTADRVGRRRTFQIGLTIFVGASLLCSLAPSVGWLVAFRMLQALGGSMLNPVAMSIIANVFTEPRDRARAIGIWGGVLGIGIAIGPLVGGMLVELLDWRAIFWINLPIGAVALGAAALFVPESRSPQPRRFDPIGQVAMVVMLASCVYAIIEAQHAGWVSAQTLSLFGLAAAALTVLLVHEPRRTDPLIELRFFRSVPFSGATLIAICAFGAFGGFLFMNTLYLQTIRGLSPLQAGLCTVPLGLTVLLCSPLSGRAVGRFGPRPSLLLAGTMICIGATMLLFLSVHTPLGFVLASYLAFGVGQGTVNAPITNTAVSGMPRSHAGVAAAVATTSRNIGTSLGVAIVGSILSSHISAMNASAFIAATRPALVVIVGFGLMVLVVGAATTGARARRTTERIAHLFPEGESAGALGGDLGDTRRGAGRIEVNAAGHQRPQ
ncbi:MFS transporter [Mycobacterium sp. ACS1612]|uniref:MFS transporter n=1 Tax=Mycobacterium sp. ACS1612 TaxID=1834117 RepID=UPI0007FD0F17|nr:MFS transporter [Mycobacterium sp. ACS1612]OBF39411.1 MFS transporter [Mycobacterium sp. ACS1612]